MTKLQQANNRKVPKIKTMLWRRTVTASEVGGEDLQFIISNCDLTSRINLRIFQFKTPILGLLKFWEWFIFFNSSVGTESSSSCWFGCIRAGETTLPRVKIKQTDYKNLPDFVLLNQSGWFIPVIKTRNWIPWLSLGIRLWTMREY